ncbi:MAG: hypothetical protein RIQ75_1781 [Pseudomonadota bacterium]|jgi:hypothetical protein
MGNTFLILLLVAAMIATVVALVRGVVAFLKTTEEDLKGDGVGPSASSVKQNKAMMHRVIFQAVAILIVVVLLASSRG